MACPQAGILAVSGDTPRKLHQIGRLSMEDAGGCAGLRLQVAEFAEQVSDSPCSFFDVLQSVQKSEQLRRSWMSRSRRRSAAWTVVVSILRSLGSPVELSIQSKDYQNYSSRQRTRTLRTAQPSMSSFDS